MALIGCNKSPGQSARQMRPYMAYLDVADGFALFCASCKDHTRVRLFGALKIPLELRVGQRVAEETCAPLDEIILCWQPGNQSIEIARAERAQRDLKRRCSFLVHQPIERPLSGFRNRKLGMHNAVLLQ